MAASKGKWCDSDPCLPSGSMAADCKLECLREAVKDIKVLALIQNYTLIQHTSLAVPVLRAQSLELELECGLHVQKLYSRNGTLYPM
jgi:hypothetical protein